MESDNDTKNIHIQFLIWLKSILYIMENDSAVNEYEILLGGPKDG